MVPERPRCWLAAALLAAWGLGCKAQTPRERFETEVAPLLEGRCLGAPCHGVRPDAEQQGEVIDWTHLNVRVTPGGKIADIDQAYAISKSRLNTVERPELSTLLRKPLGGAAGLPHEGGVVFWSSDDEAYRAILGWAQVEQGGGEGGSESDLTPSERTFARTVLPRLASRQCMNAPCHGPFAPFTGFQPPVELGGAQVFSFEAVRANHAAARMHLFLGGDVALSRLARKALPFERGGIAHRGGNDIFFSQGEASDGRDDPDAAAIMAWAAQVQAEALGGPPTLRGAVFVRGPVAPSSPFDHGAFTPGTDLFVLEPLSPSGARRNLTSAAHPEGPADVRDPAVRHDGARVAFAMRKGDGDALNIYEIGVDGEGLRQLTHDAAALPRGGVAASAQPTYGPDGRIYFVSTRAGHLAERHARLDTDVWAVDPATGALERITHDPAPEATPTFFGVGKSYGTLAFTVLRAAGERDHGVVFRMPLDHNKRYHGDPELHIHHGLTAPGQIVYGAKTMPDGRASAVLLDTTSLLRAGPLCVFDRQMGPELPPGQEATSASGGFKHAFARLSPPDAPPGGFRHPSPLPDGRLLVTAVGASGGLELRALTLREDRQSGGPVVDASQTFPSGSAEPEYDAEPLVARPLEDDPTHERAWDPSATTGTLAYRHVETLEAIMANLEPRGPRPLRGDLVYARIIESLPVYPDELSAGPISAGSHARERILAEVPLLGGSLLLEVPASRPLRIQTLNADRMAVGAQHRRWVDVAPGQKFPGGVSPALYPTLCAGCHGSLSGERGGGNGPVPDLITGASMTMATHQNLDPRRPLAPVPMSSNSIEIDYRRDVLPLLERSCAGCHRGPSPAGGLDLEPRPGGSFDASYEALLAPGEGSGNGRRLVDEPGSSAYTSALVERIYGRELGAPATLTGACPGEPPLSEDERMTVVRWIDLGAAYRGAGP